MVKTEIKSPNDKVPGKSSNTLLAIKEKVEQLPFLLIAVVSIVLTVADTFGLRDKIPWFQGMTSNITITLLGLIAIYLVLERRSKLDEIQNNIKSLSTFADHFSDDFDLLDSVKKSGIRSVEIWPINIPKTAREIDIVLVRSVAWLALQSTTIEGAIKDTGSDIRICLVHPLSPMISTLASKHDENDQETTEKILDSILALVVLGERTKRENGKGRLQIRCHKLVPSYAYYRFDENAYVLLYGLRRGKIDFPMLSLVAGSLMAFLQNDFDRLWSEHDTELIYDLALAVEDNRNSLATLQVSEETLNRVFKI